MIDFDAQVLGPCLATFGEQVIYLPAGGVPTPVVGVFDAKYTETRWDDEKGVEVTSSRPMLSFRTAAIGADRPTLSELFLLRGRAWRVSEPPIADGQGHVRVPLQLATDADAATPLAPPIPPAPVLS